MKSILRMIVPLLLGLAVINKVHAAERVFFLASDADPPFVQNTDGRAAGILVDILRHALAEMDWRLEVIILPRRRAELYVDSGRAHGLILPTRVGWRAEKFRYTVPVLSVEAAFFTRGDYSGPAFRNFGDAARSDVVVVLGDALVEELSGRGIVAVSAPNMKIAVRMMKAGRIHSVLALKRSAIEAFYGEWPDADIRVDVIGKRPLYLALGRKGRKPSFSKERFDEILTSLTRQGVVDDIARRYTRSW